MSDVRRRIEKMATTVNSSVCKINNSQTSLLANDRIVNAVAQPAMSPMVQPSMISAPVTPFTKVVLHVVTSAAYATSTYAVEEMSLRSTISNAANTVSSNTMPNITVNISTAIVSSTQQNV